MLLVDTSELKRPTQRKLHAAWHELHGRQVLASPTVADELAPFATDTLGTTAPSGAETRLETQAGTLSRRRENELKQQAWWAAMWRDSTSPYRIVNLTPDQEALAERIRTEIDTRCFPTTDPIDIPDLNDAKIVTESLTLGAKMLLTSNLRTIDRFEVNRWTVEHGREWGVKAEPFLYDADERFTSWTTDPVSLERWIQAGLLACWPPTDDADPMIVIERTIGGMEALRRGTGGMLTSAAERLLNGLDKHPDPVELVERTRAKLPSKTVETDRLHPAYQYEAPAAGGTAPGPLAAT